jgi:hypothetical protein
MQPARVSARQQIIQVAHAFVRQNINPELQTAFAGDDETTVENLSNSKFMISGWVDLVSRQGRPNRQNFSLVVYKNASDRWIGESIAVTPQM